MKIAVTYENEKVFQHFGHSEQFKIYEVEDKEILNSEIIETNGQGHSALSEVLSKKGIDSLICGGIGDGAKEALKEAGIKLYPGVTGSADKAVEDLLNETLKYNKNTACRNHHGNHNCGENNCGEHKHHHKHQHQHQHKHQHKQQE